VNDELRALGGVRARGIMLLIVVALAAGAAGGAIDRAWVASREGSAGFLALGDRTVRVNPELRREGGRPREEPRDGPARREGEGRLRPAGAGEDSIPYSLRSVTLTQAQRTRIIAITAKYTPVAESVMRSVGPRVAELSRRMSQEAMCVLTPKQRDDWVAWRRRERLNGEESKQLLALVDSNSCPKP
jgi:hypothetical protein